jgi:hypothetical protein
MTVHGEGLMTNDTELLITRVAEVFITIDLKRGDKMKPDLRPNDNLITCLTNGRQYNLSSDLKTRDDYLAADQGWTKANHTHANLSCKAHDCTPAMLKAAAQSTPTNVMPMPLRPILAMKMST